MSTYRKSPPTRLPPIDTTATAMDRAAIYARYSTDNQRAASIVDQQRRCREFADRNNLTVGQLWADEAEKGWNPEREQLQAMLAAAKNKKFDVLLVDDLSRLHRDLGGQDKTLKRLRILGIRVVAIADGWDSTSRGAKQTAAFKGLLNEMQLEVIAEHTKRGQDGRIHAGLSAGGTVYGYRSVQELVHGDVVGARRMIEPEEARIVGEIYEQYADGLSPQAIADRLNARGVPSPRGDTWSRNAIYGDRRDLSGILSNPIYEGWLLRNRSQFVRDPDTGGRVKVRNPPESWLWVEAPELRTVPEDLVARVKQRMADVESKGKAIREGRANANARTGADGKYILTGLFHCSECGGPISSVARDTFGCSARHNRGPYACGNDVKFKREVAESAVLEAVATRVFSPAAVREFVELVAQEHSAQSGTGRDQLAALEKKLKEVNNGISKGVEFVFAGNVSPAVSAKLKELESTKKVIQAELDHLAVQQSIGPAVDLAELQAAANAALGQVIEEIPSWNPAEARQVLSGLIKNGVVTPSSDKRTLTMTMTGDIAGLLTIGANKQRKGCTAPKSKRPDEISIGPKLGSVVARARFELATFGL